MVAGTETRVHEPLSSEGLLARVQVPTLSESTRRLIELVNDPDAGVNSFAEVIEQDPGLSALVLRLVNSSLYGVRTHVDTVQAACVIIDLSSTS